MTHSILRTFVLLAGCTLTAGHAAAQGCMPVGGTIDASVVGGEPVNVLGSVTGDLAGATRAVVQEQTAQDDGTVSLRLVHDFVLADRGTLRTEDTATWTPVAGSPGVFHMKTEYRITGGTGRYEGASGAFTNEGIADTNAGLLTLRYSGELCPAGQPG
ncbi:hypothetical protein OG2516_12071 [Oceanicola granulosus HTCC2516]|uniref:Uncharacterized protein n=1 Tax=Oceanicola granulosus (strain ATCC BAA-861 / DSM 15982 / KCTC 12143 / HTCC2516) TaxID=314256 RepID=Q2CBB0_OCEGH|nr:hypothetical protein [Oceanicola granulosus]EAR49988.1 hypothetical protein OG2516_12071 [Oceanicola granulosus HTCC2516]